MPDTLPVPRVEVRRSTWTRASHAYRVHIYFAPSVFVLDWRRSTDRADTMERANAIVKATGYPLYVHGELESNA